VKDTGVCAHNVADGGLMLNVGKGFTISATVFVPEHPALLLAFTVYVVLMVGETEITVALPKPVQV
jgi:hypothetical protein